MTKEEKEMEDIYFQVHRAGENLCFDEIFRMMKIYADQQSKIKAIEFAEWCGENSIGYEESIWFYKDKTGRYNSNTEEMYTLYNQSLK